MIYDYKNPAAYQPEQIARAAELIIAGRTMRQAAEETGIKYHSLMGYVHNRPVPVVYRMYEAVLERARLVLGDRAKHLK